MRSDKAYSQRMTGGGKIFKDHQLERVLCPECGKDIKKGTLVTHLHTHHGVAKGGLVSEGGGVDEDDRFDNPRSYKMAFSEWAGPRP